MTRLRQVGLAALVLAVVVTVRPAPAEAAFTASGALPTMTVSTGSLQPPTNVTAQLTACNNGRWMSVSVSWTATPSPRVTGYVMTAHRNDGSTVTVAQVSPSTTTVPTTVDKLASGSTTVTFTVAAQFNGWTAESLPSGPITC